MNHIVMSRSFFRVAWCAFLAFILSVSIFLVPFSESFAQEKVQKITVEVRPDAMIEIDGERVALKDPLLFYKNKFYMSIKSWDYIQNHKTTWNRPRSVLEVNPYETPIPDDEQPNPTPKKNTNSNNNNNNSTSNLNGKKNTPRPSGFAFKTATPLPNVNTPKSTQGAFLFQTATPVPTPGPNNNGNSTNGGKNGGTGQSGSGTTNGGSTNGVSNETATSTSNKTPRPSPTLKPTPKRNVIPVTSGTPFPVKFGKIMNYQFSYLDKSVPIGAILYKDSLFVRQRDLKELDFDWTNVPVFNEEVTKEPLILIDELKNRLVDIPQTTILNGPIISKSIPAEKLNPMTILLEQFGVVSRKRLPNDTNFFKWIQPTSNRNEFVAYSQNELNGNVTEYIFSVNDGISGSAFTRLIKTTEIK